MSGGVRLALSLPWLALLVAARWLLLERLVPGGDLRKFMPARVGSRLTAGSKAARAACARRRATSLLPWVAGAPA